MYLMQAVTRVVQYDSRGRVKKASGVGTTHKMGSGHEITTSYGVVFQEEIDKLFGTDVGYAEHYRKNVVEDANGQRTMSYETLTGQVIATAIIGEGPEESNGRKILKDLDVTGYGYPTSRVETVDLTNYNVYNSDRKSWLIEREFTVDEPGTYTFDYNINPQTFNHDCINGDCEYELTFYLYDEYGNEKILDVERPIKLTSTTVTSNPYQSFSRNFVSGDEGSYTIVKELRLINNNMSEFIKAEIEDGSTPCYTPDDYMIPATIDCVVEIVLLSDIPNPINCNTIEYLMKSDVSPGGQYFDLWLANELAASGIVGDLTTLVAANIGNFTSFNDLQQNWQSVYADELMKLHPEYCYNIWCQTLNDGITFDIAFQGIEEDDELNTYKYMTSCGSSSPQHGLLNGPYKDDFYDLVGNMSHPNGGT